MISVQAYPAYSEPASFAKSLSELFDLGNNLGVIRLRC